MNISAIVNENINAFLEQKILKYVSTQFYIHTITIIKHIYNNKLFENNQSLTIVEMIKLQKFSWCSENNARSFE